MLARQLLARHKGGNKQIIMITDGEPTAHLEGSQPEFAYPPTRRTLQETLKEVSAAPARASRSIPSCWSTATP